MISLWLKSFENQPERLPIRLQMEELDGVALSLAVGEHLKGLGKKVATAESCTAGGIAALLSAVSGSSDWLEGGFVTYSNTAKTTLLGVSSELIAEHGAVSEAVVSAMAQGAQARLETDLAVAVSGIAGPTGGSPDKPVGTVWFAWAGLAGPGSLKTLRLVFSGDRAEVRHQTALIGLVGLLSAR